MNRLETIKSQRQMRAHRVKERVHGSAVRPRLVVNISNKHITAQLIDDDTSKTMAYISSAALPSAPNNMTEKAAFIGQRIAALAKQKKIKEATLDRREKRYHGRLKMLADSARQEGLKI